MTDSNTEVPVLDGDELIEYIETARWHRQHGRPEKAVPIEIAIKDRSILSDDRKRELLTMNAPLIAPVNIDPSIKIPPRHGPGSSTKNWQKFAQEVTDMDEGVIKDTGKNDLIKILEAEGIIERER